MNNENEKAKELFIAFGCDYFFMNREGVLNQYQKHNISKEEELLWIKEYQQTVIACVREFAGREKTIYASKLSNLIATYLDVEIFIEFYNEIEKSSKYDDTFTTIRMCEEFIHSISPRFLKINYGEVEKLSIQILEILYKLGKSDITVLEEYHNKSYMANILTEDCLQKRIENDIIELRRILSCEKKISKV